jgi:serine/threonine protein kinase
MAVPRDIYSRCVLHDIFTEITCLENFRLEPYVTDLYDYGVTATDYVIVMKKYPFSLRDWRLRQKGAWQDNLSSYLTLYKEILRAVHLLHQHNVVHYDLKADNVLLDVKAGDSGGGNLFLIQIF